MKTINIGFRLIAALAVSRARCTGSLADGTLFRKSQRGERGASN